MSRLIFLSLIWLLHTNSVTALMGFDGDAYFPLCAHGCLRALSAPMLTCSTPDTPSSDMMALNMMTEPSCFASNKPYLSSLAYCVNQQCASFNYSSLQLETFWSTYATGYATLPPEMSYSDALAMVEIPPTKYVVSSMSSVLNETMLANQSTMALQTSTLYSVGYENRLEGRYGIGILVAFIALPMLTTILGWLPYTTSVTDRIKPYLIWPSIIGTYHVRPLPHRLGNAPTLGQGFYILAFVIVNIIMTATAYRVAVPHGWYGNDRYYAVMAYIMWRTGAFALCYLPLVILFSGRNNVLLWLSNWSHSTYMLLHRWIARVFALHVILHSILGLALYVKTHSYETNYYLPWWIWGIVGTIATTIMLVGSGLYVRKWSYEVFLITHMIMAILTIVGTWYHVWYRFMWLGNYQQPIYAACGVWFFDRMVRVTRTLKNGIRYAKVTELGEGYVRIDVPGVRWGATPGQNAYAYFPTLNKTRPWENHPFSVLPTSLLQSYQHHMVSSLEASQSVSSRDDQEVLDVEEKNVVHSSTRRSATATTTEGVTFFVRKSTGTTKELCANPRLMTLLDGPYPNNPTAAVMRTDRLLVITGGIGVSGVLPWIFAHPNVKFAWSVKQSAECLVTALDVVLDGVMEKDVRVGSRIDVAALVKEEVEAGWKKIGVVVCGPGGLCDDVRAVVCAAAKGPTAFELEVDAYSW